MKRILAQLALAAALALGALLAPPAYAVPVCTAVNFSASTSGTSSTQNYTLPTGHASGDLDIIVTSSRGAETVSTPPTGYTLLKTTAAAAFSVYGKIDNGSETNPSVVWSGTAMHSGFMLTLRTTTSWASIGSIVVDSATGVSTITTQRYRSLTVTANNTCAVQASSKNTTTVLSNPTVNVTAGYTAGGIGFNNSTNSVITSLQFQSQGTATNLTQNDETINGNSDSTSSSGVAFDLQMTNTPPTFSVNPATGTLTTSSVPITATTACTDCTMYGIEQTAGAAAPSVTQIKAGQNGGGTAAFKTCSVAMTASVQATCTFSSITDGTVKDAYFALNSTANGDIASAFSIANVYKLPAFTSNPAFSSCGTGGCTYSFTPDGAGTVYIVACKAGSTAATVAQVEAGQCTGGVAAQAAANKSVSGADTIVSGSALTNPIYDFAVVLTYGSQHEAATHADTNRILTAPATCGGNGTTQCQYIQIASIGTGSPCATFNGATSPAIAASDILKAPTTTHPGNYALTIGTDCQFSYTGDSSRQDALNIGVYDYSVQAMHADSINFWANNLPPVPPAADSVSFIWQVGTPITPIDLRTYCPDPEGDAVTVTAVSGLAAGMSITSSTISGTPTTPGITTLTLRCTDAPGASVDWH